jgi:hypothetical protein
MSDIDRVVGHKTFINAAGEYSHTPLLQSEADELMAIIDANEKRRKELMPDEAAAINLMFDAYQRLKELGWNDAQYCPKDGSTFDSIEVGSTGIHRSHYSGVWPNGVWYTHDRGDLWPAHPILYRK